MNKSLKVSILTPDKVVLKEEANKVYTITKEGEIEFLPGYMPIIVSTVPGITIIETIDKQKIKLFTNEGIIKIKDDILNFCCDSAEVASDIDFERVEKSIKNADRKSVV